MWIKPGLFLLIMINFIGVQAGGEWKLGMNINPCDGANFGYGGPWAPASDVGSANESLAKDFVDSSVWETAASFVTITRHVDGQCTMSKTWELKDKTKSMYDYFSTYPGRIYATGDGTVNDNHISSDIPEASEGLEGTWRDPIFGAEGGLVFNWYYSNNGARIAVPGGYKIPYTLPSVSDNDEDLHGLGNELSGDTINGNGGGEWSDVAMIGPDCFGYRALTCQVVGTDRSLYSKHDGPCWGSYAIFVSQTASAFSCQGRNLSQIINADSCEKILCSSTNGCSLVKNTLLTTLPQLNKEFFISFEFEAREYMSGWQSVIHFTEGGDCCQVGKRVPGFWVRDAGQLYPKFAVNGNGDYGILTDKEYSLNNWHSVQFSQSLKNGKYMYRVVIDGEDVIGPMENNQPQSFSNIKVYGADNFYNSLKGSIKNLIINTYSPNGCEE